jgi:hypothetical protein
MTCYHPLQAWYSKEINPSGKRSLVFNPKKAHQPDAPLEIACGQCIGCRLERSRQWAIRCTHEASLYEDNCFITLTFDDDNLYKRDNPWSLDVRDFQLFMKRLRKQYGDGIRFYHCGEYGDLYKRPHYHACLFNFDFPDKQLWRVINGHRLYRSPSLERIWPYGFSTVGTMTFESAAYCARYILKKQTGDNAEKRYHAIDDETGEYFDLKPEYNTMSRRPGIAAGWYEKFRDDVYPHDYVVMRGKKMRPPKFYDRLLERTRPYEFDQIKEDRVMSAMVHDDNLTPERLAVRELCKLEQLKKLPRNLDGEI